MDTIFMNSENSKTSKPHVLIRNFTDKTDLRRGEKSIALLFIKHGKAEKAHTTITNLEDLLQHGMINLNH